MKRLLILLTFMSMTYFTKAGADPAPTTEGKIRLGLHISPMGGFVNSDKASIKNGGVRLGYGMGVIFDLKFADNYFFATGLNFLNSSFKMNFVDTLRYSATSPAINTNDVDFKYKLQYIGLPLTLKLKTNEVNYFKYFVQFGVEPQFNTGKKVNANKGYYAGSEYNLPSSTTYDNFNDDISFIRMSACGGIGVEYSLGGKTALLGSIMYNNGLTDVSKQQNSKITSSYVALNLGILF